MTLTGGPSLPVHTLADAVAHASSSSFVDYGVVPVEGYRFATVTVIADQACAMRLRGSALPAPGSTLAGLVHLRGGANVSLAQPSTIAVAASTPTGAGLAFQIDVAALRWLQVHVQNNSGATATITIRVALAA
jgi:hypothetical protein